MSADVTEALEALARGDQALVRGLPGAQAEFEAALAGLRSPALRLAEGHAVRGLAQCLLAAGHTADSEMHAREAVSLYQRLRTQLETGDGRAAHAVLWRDALEAEAASLVLLAEILLREGRGSEARESLSYARAIYQDLGTGAAAGALAGMGRVALREGRYRAAEEAFLKALSAHRQAGHLAGQVGTWLQLSELYRIEGRLEDAERALEAARPLAHDAESPLLVARVLAGLGAVMLQIPRPSAAVSLYEEALPRVRQAGDREMEGFVRLGLGQAMSRAQLPGAEEHLTAGIGILAELGHHHGIAGGMHRVSEHCFRVERPLAALLAAEVARRMWSDADPRRGVGQALRMVVKSLAALGHYREALTAALAREHIAGDIQPNAKAVATYYREHLPAAWVFELEALDPDDLQRESALRTAGVLAASELPAGSGGLDLEEMSTIEGALGALQLALSDMLRPPAGGDPLDEPTGLHAEPVAADVAVPSVVDPEESE